MNNQAFLPLALGTFFAVIIWMSLNSGTVSIRGRDFYKEEEDASAFWFGIWMFALPAIFFFYHGVRILIGAK